MPGSLSPDDFFLNDVLTAPFVAGVFFPAFLVDRNALGVASLDSISGSFFAALDVNLSWGDLLELRIITFSLLYSYQRDKGKKENKTFHH
jgi:hypothetical protein